MKKWITVLAVLLIVALTAGCTSSSGPKTYNSNGISFQYPGDWSTDYKSDVQSSAGSSGETLVSLGKDDAGMAVVKMDSGSVNLNMADVAAAFKKSMQSSGSEFVSEKTRTIDGAKGYETVLKDTNSTLYYSSTFLKKGNDIYFIVIANPDNSQQTVDMILNSFKVQ